jgi:hypothetical protein
VSSSAGLAGSAEKKMTIPELYRPIERAVLAKYLQIPDPRPDDLADLDPTRPVPRRWSERRDGIAPQRSETGSNHLVVENAVARICLEPIANELPQWAAIANGSIVRGRARSRSRSNRRLAPVHLLTVNWGDSGPGFSWPEAYHVTWLPGYDASLVTASADCPDTHGYCDRAVGWFSGRSDFVESAARVLAAYWVSQLEFGQERWEYLFDEGALNERAAHRSADSVWTAEEADE